MIAKRRYRRRARDELMCPGYDLRMGDHGDRPRAVLWAIIGRSCGDRPYVT